MVAAVGSALKLSRPLSPNGCAQLAGAQDAHLCAFRSGDGCGYNVAAGKNWRFAQLGLPLLLAPRCLAYGPFLARLGLYGRGRELSHLAVACHAADSAGAA